MYHPLLHPTPPGKHSAGGSGKSGKKSSGGGGSKGGLRAEMEGLRAHLDTTNSDRTPLSGETLRQFYRYVTNTQFVPADSFRAATPATAD